MRRDKLHILGATVPTSANLQHATADRLDSSTYEAKSDAASLDATGQAKGGRQQKARSGQHILGARPTNSRILPCASQARHEDGIPVLGPCYYQQEASPGCIQLRSTLNHM
mmetsp:Transcript_13171/g.19964  ORF Transcript_13171/g.19964 Transcript_13171/m.19964 type:complete len:111 (-) Transcript_13171:251-583(-)|eukprot:CAMPEP_0194754126 /NCGR_PEP_ID=MMETSP0323_2-20130528/8119_1 /TAXON_ID=2866 ORGANISM="Crypthecodinium cohnii, Strain Seligo" /NCGR_SAMPLE_ID=MMETSP0323_2 /ASSEMBLY_ACC=CAM_ASM_000346 /LENGTH=110 /DNA_ID=CAMNT_0039672475 /DNA_START=303 /DNA_END=635 /DNA_ORIENTATION=-